MTTPRFHPEAQAELDSAAGWYEERRPGYGVRFVSRVRDVVRFVTAAPHGGTPWRGGPVRTWRVARFPFVVVYSVEPTSILVVAVAHTKRRPGYWTARLGQ